MKALYALLAVSSIAIAEELPTMFVHNYADNVQIVLTPDDCDKADKSAGWIAYAMKIDTQDKVFGCWRHDPDGMTVDIWVNPKEREYIDFQFYKNKFEPVYEK